MTLLLRWTSTTNCLLWSGPDSPGQDIFQLLLRILLDDLLEGGLVILEVPLALVVRFLFDKAQHEPPAPAPVRRLRTWRDDRLKRVRQDGGPLRPPGEPFPLAQQQIVSKPQLPRIGAQGLFAHHRRPQLGQLPLRARSPFQTDISPPQNPARNPQELQPLVAFQPVPPLVGIGGMRQRLLQQPGIPKCGTPAYPSAPYTRCSCRVHSFPTACPRYTPPCPPASRTHPAPRPESPRRRAPPGSAPYRCARRG